MHKVLFVTSEAHPLIKTGGLADVSGALPRALLASGCDVRLLLPAYHDALTKAANFRVVARFVPPGAGTTASILEGYLPGTRVKTWLLDHPSFTQRAGNPYLDASGQPWPDNAERFALLARCGVALAQNLAGLNWAPDVVHCNDWQTGLIPALLAGEAQRPGTVFTIHNLAYQGLFDRSVFQALDLPEALWTHHALEFHDQLSFIKGGLVFADRINTVSARYADEIQTPQFGYGLEGLLRYRSTVLSGIVNGIDEQEWNPGADPHLPAAFNWQRLDGKTRNRLALLKECGLPRKKNALLLGLIGRMVEQKGVDLILEAMPRLLQLPVQLVVLGSGERRFEEAFRHWATQRPDRIAVRIGYDEGLAHRIEAGSDAFLMPSRFEPCGLNQLYSLRYGAIPIVHRVGGLADTVTDTTEQSLADGTATGIVFDEASTPELLRAVERALRCFGDARLWRQIMRTGMRQKFTWRESAAHYLDLYDHAVRRD